MERLTISDLELAPDIQPRASMNFIIIQEYANDMQSGIEFPPVDAIFDGQHYWIWDGFHRVKAAELAQLSCLPVNIQHGTKQDAQWLALSANKAHGLRRTNEDKRRAVEIALQHPKAASRSTREIADHCGVANSFVHKLKVELSVHGEQIEVTRNGSTYTMDVSNIGKRAGPESEPVNNPSLFPQDENLDATLEDQESAFTCQECGEVMDLEKWHCSTCHGHWPLTTKVCPNCMPQIVEEVDGCKVVFGDARKLDLSQFERYGVIVADPPWQYRVSKGQGTADDQYDTMTDEGLRAMPVADLAKPDSVLLMWGTWPKMPEALSLMNAWGFEYVTGFPWIKTTNGNNIDYGVGYWVRGVSEYVIIGKRGGVSVESLRVKGFMGLLAENDGSSTQMWLGGPNLQHSRKPDSVHELAQALPGPYLELFARRARHGWTVFGNDKELFQKTLA